MKSRWASALVKTLIFWVVTHVIFLVLGFFIRTDIGIFHLPMWWAHWSDNVRDAIIGIVLSVITYLIIYFFFTHEEPEHIESTQ